MKCQLSLFFFFSLFRLINSGFFKNLPFIKFSPGDRIYCSAIPLSPIYHSMLATSNDTFIHLIDNQVNNKGLITEVTRQDFINTNNAEEYCENWGPGPLGPVESVKRAKLWIGERVYYNKLTCNCQHFINFWTSGSAGHSFSTRFITSTKCPVKLKLINPY